MKRIIVLLTVLFVTVSFAASGKELATKLALSASSKAGKQWKRVFKSKRKLKRYGIDKLNDDEKNILKQYLINHAADSDAPEAAGI